VKVDGREVEVKEYRPFGYVASWRLLLLRKPTGWNGGVDG
jgi:hypothetical protein